MTSGPKFYLFNVVGANQLSKSNIKELSGSIAGKALEQYIFTEIIDYGRLKRLEFEIALYKTKTEQEVNFILSSKKLTDIEVKRTDDIKNKNIGGLLQFGKENVKAKIMLV